MARKSGDWYWVFRWDEWWSKGSAGYGETRADQPRAQAKSSVPIKSRSDADIESVSQIMATAKVLLCSQIKRQEVEAIFNLTH